MGGGIGCINSQRRSCLVWVWGHVERCALAVGFDGVAYAVGDISLLQPRRPASVDGFNPSSVTKRVGLGFGFGFGSGLGHGSWPEAESESCETRTLRAGADGTRRNPMGRHHGSCASRFGIPCSPFSVPSLSAQTSGVPPRGRLS